MKDLARMVIVLTAICLVAALALSQVYAVTKGPIEKANRAEKLMAIKAVLPDYDNEPDKGEKKIGNRIYYPGTIANKPVGFAFEAVSPNGYSGEIKVLVGVLPDGSVNGLEILDHKETPGLGQKIEDEKWTQKVIFKDPIKKTHRTLANTKWNVKKDGGEIDQISGATISPRAVVEAVKGGLEDYNSAKGQLLSEETGAPEKIKATQMKSTEKTEVDKEVVLEEKP